MGQNIQSEYFGYDFLFDVGLSNFLLVINTTFKIQQSFNDMCVVTLLDIITCSNRSMDGYASAKKVYLIIY